MRVIDASRFGEIMEQWKKDCLEDNDTQGADIISDVMLQLDDMPTLTPPNEWVSVEDRLPDYSDGMVLLTDGNIVQTGYRNWLFRMDWLPGVYCPKQRPSGGEMRVTHWLPLPEPPERKSEDE